jgi:mRNA interferase YafQ
MLLIQTKNFTKDLQKIKMSDKHFTRFVQILSCLSRSETLPEDAKDHALKGEWDDFRECHISGDLLLIYQQVGETIKLVRMGSHSQLFKSC